MKDFVFIAGPCVIEENSSLDEAAAFLKELFEKMGLLDNFYFKASYDKANRTSLDSYRGVGLARGVEMLAEVKEKYGVKILTDIHLPQEAFIAAEVADILQVPAFLCRQTDIVVAAAKACAASGCKGVNIKKGQFMDPMDMKFSVEKVKRTNSKAEVWVTERGTFFGYGNLVVDYKGVVRMREANFADKVVFDATHSVQQREGKVTGGNRDYALYLARAAAAVGVDGIFAEVHPEPDKALSDAKNSLNFELYERLVKDVLDIRRTLGFE